MLLGGREGFRYTSARLKSAGSGSWRKETHGVEICARRNHLRMNTDIEKSLSSAGMIRMLMIPSCRYEMGAC